MAKNKVKTERKKPETSPAEEGTKTTLEAAQKQEDNKEGLRVDPTIEQKETEKAKEIKAEQKKVKEANDEEVAKEVAKLRADDQVKGGVQSAKVITESKELIKAVKADAEKRGKTFTQDPVTGVLIVK